MKKKRITLALMIATAAAMAGTTGVASASTILGQTYTDGVYFGSKDYGQQIIVDPSGNSFPAQDHALQSATFYAGDPAYYTGTATSLYIDVYSQGTTGTSTVDFTAATPGSNLTYLGSSSNNFNFTTASTGDTFKWNFANINLPTNENVFLVFSSDSAAGNFVGASMEQDDASTSASWTNITSSQSIPLTAGTNATNAKDHIYSVSLAPVPEPASLALMGLGGLLLLVRRRRSVAC